MFKLNQVVYVDQEQRTIVGIHNTVLGTVYDTLDANNEIEVCFEHQLKTS